MKLEEQGIKTFIPDQYTASLTPLNACTLDGIRVQIDAQDLPRAREMLKGVLPQVASGMCTCPQCGSNSVGHALGSKLLGVLSLLLLGLPLHQETASHGNASGVAIGQVTHLCRLTITSRCAALL